MRDFIKLLTWGKYVAVLRGVGAHMRGPVVESDYLRSALSVTQLVLRARLVPTESATSLPMSLMVADALGALNQPDGLPTPEEIGR